MFSLLVLLVLAAPLILAQLPLPQHPFLPPNATAGIQPSTGRFPNPQWSTLLGNLLYFYEAQRSGVLSPTNRVVWRNSSSIHDGQDVSLDLSGGYYDAGDYMKFTYPLSFTLMSICWGATDFGKGYDLANQTAYLDDMLRWGLDWLMKAHPQNSTLYVQVGDVDSNHAYWGGDLNIPTTRPSYQINDTHPGTDAAAAASAAFSSCSNLYANRTFNGPYSGPASLQNSTYATTLFTHAQQLYTFALNATGGQRTYQNSVPVVSQSYPSSSYGDDLTLAALFLSIAANSTSVYQQAEILYRQYKLAGQNGVFNWDSKTPGLAVLFAQLNQASYGFGGNLTAYQMEAERYFDRILNHTGPSYMTSGGLLFYPGDSDEASLNPAMNAVMLMARYAQMATIPEKKSRYLSFAKTQVDYMLGKNPMSVPYVVGSNPNSPSNPHSALASGGNDISNINSSPPQEAYVLYGAVVGGPDKKDRFWDIRSDWPQTEPALDLNSPILTLTSMHVIYDSDDPYFTILQPGEYAKVKPTGQPCDAAFNCFPPHLNQAGTIALISVITLVGVIIVALACWYMILLWFNSKA